MFRRNKTEEPSRKSCMQDYRDGDHAWYKWRNKRVVVMKDKLGFEAEVSTTRYQGMVVEQWRVCKECNLTELRILG